MKFLYNKTSGIVGYGYTVSSPSSSIKIFDLEAYLEWLEVQMVEICDDFPS